MVPYKFFLNWKNSLRILFFLTKTEEKSIFLKFSSEQSIIYNSVDQEKNIICATCKNF